MAVWRSRCEYNVQKQQQQPARQKAGIEYCFMMRGSSSTTNRATL